jgi:hypothetical protein
MQIDLQRDQHVFPLVSLNQGGISGRMIRRLDELMS